MAARHAASGRRAHQMWSVEMWPWRIDFSRADSALTSRSGNATSMRRLGVPGSDTEFNFLLDWQISAGRDIEPAQGRQVADRPCDFRLIQ